MESELVKGSIKNELVKETPEVKHEDETPFTEEKSRESSSSSSSSSDSPLEVDNDEKGHLQNSSVTPEIDGKFSSSPESVSSPVKASAPSPSAETGMQKSLPEQPEMKSPPIQTMGHPPGYDPNCIPASIFSTKTGDWSTTSNESLFSIHMGNNSFSRDYEILFGKSEEPSRLNDMNNSQSSPFSLSTELPRLEEWSNPPSNHRHVSEAKSSDLGSLPPVMEPPSQEENSVPSGELSRIEKKDENISPKFVSGQTTESHGKENAVSAEAVDSPAAKKSLVPETNLSSLSNPPVSSPNTPRMSDVSGQSGSSFAFPVLGSDSGKTDSLSVAPEKPEKPVRSERPEGKTQPQVSKETPINFSGTRWFSCFSCWPRFC